MGQIVSIRAGKSLDELVTDIRGHLYDAQGAETKLTKHRLAAGQLLVALRKRIEAGEAGEGVNWWEWYGTKFTRSRKDAEKLMRMAVSDDPEAAAEVERAETRQRVAEHREAVERTYAPQINQTHSDYDIVSHALRLVEKMDAEQRERFDAAYQEKYHDAVS